MRLSQFHQNIHQTYGQKGEKWLRTLPEILETCAVLWQLKIVPTKERLSYNYVTPVVLADGSEAILKLGFPEEIELQTEMQTLGFYNGKFSVNLLNKHESLGALLLEKIKPAKSLREIQKDDDEAATRIAAPLMRKLLMDVPDGHSLPHLKDWMEVIERMRKAEILYNISENVLNFAMKLYGDLERTQPSSYLLHGDLHHDNILWDRHRGWVAIDPKGLIGEPALQAARFIRNLWGTPPTKKMLEKRISIISNELNASRRRITSYAYLDFIIGNCWILAGNEGHIIDHSFERILRELLASFL